jgi:DNA-binding PadR family transcriptional regulator
MKSIYELSSFPAGVSLLADSIIEFHAARILLLIGLCGTKDCLDGLTKLAKLDFFVRYPQFFNKACEDTGDSYQSAYNYVESSMIRHHYGPWDHRYYEILAYLRSRGLIQITKEGNTYKFKLTTMGKEHMKNLAKDQSYRELCDQMKQVKRAFGKKTGSALKKMIYDIFQQEVTKKSLGDVIE